MSIPHILNAALALFWIVVAFGAFATFRSRGKYFTLVGGLMLAVSHILMLFMRFK